MSERPTPRDRLAELTFRVVERLRTIHPAAWLTFLFAFLFAVLFAGLGVSNHRNYGTWSYDMGIYDQGIWLISRGEQFMSVRGMNFWGHHFNLIAYLFVPFYWMGLGGPELLYVVQAIALAWAAFPVYLIARDKFAKPWIGFLFALVYLLYAPVQWISWAMFHPEALVIAPFLYAWWFATKERWGWFLAMVLLALSTREDVALAVMMLGVVLAIYMRAAPNYRRILWRCAGTFVLGAVWYLVAGRLLVLFNDGKEPFYITYFYGNYGDTGPEVVETMLLHPDRVVSDAVQHDRLKFYKQLGWPLAWLPLFNPLALLMAVPQMLASVTSLSPYSRMINYQYTSVMIAPLMISSIHGGHMLYRFRPARWSLPIAMVLCALVSNIAWAPSPIGQPGNYYAWAQNSPRRPSLDHAVSLIPDDASVSASYQLVPHMSHRHEVYDWPNPFWASVWGNDDCGRLPDPTTVEYVALDQSQIGSGNYLLYESMRAPGGPFEVIYEDAIVVVLKRVGTSPAVDELPQASSCRMLASRHGAG